MALPQAAVDAAPRILDLKPGDVVLHWKRDTSYFIRHVGASRLQCGDSRHDGSPLVEYVAIEAPHEVWHRPAMEFTEDRFALEGRWSEWVDVARAKVDALVAERRRLLGEWPGTVEEFDAAPEHLGLRQSIAARRADVEEMLRLQAVLEGRQ